MPKRRIVIPEIVAIARELDARGLTTMANKLDPNRRLRAVKSVARPDLGKMRSDKMAKFKFLCDGGTDGD